MIIGIVIISVQLLSCSFGVLMSTFSRCFVGFENKGMVFKCWSFLRTYAGPISG